MGVLAYHNLGYAEQGDHLGLRWGITGLYRALIPVRKVQAVVLRATPLDRSLGLAALTVYVAGGSPTTLRDLPRGEARQLQARLARRAAASRFVW
jgi:putative membrane protein